MGQFLGIDALAAVVFDELALVSALRLQIEAQPSLGTADLAY